jgi:hypothetical protein
MNLLEDVEKRMTCQLILILCDLINDDEQLSHLPYITSSKSNLFFIKCYIYYCLSSLLSSVWTTEFVVRLLYSIPPYGNRSTHAFS